MQIAKTGETEEGRIEMGKKDRDRTGKKGDRKRLRVSSGGLK